VARRGRAVVVRVRALEPPPQKVLRATPEEETAFRAALEAQLVPSGHTGGPLVSILVPTHNGLAHVTRLLAALERAAYADIELVVVDNASADGTADLLAGASPRIPLHVIRNPVNATFSHANNQAAARAGGEYLLLLNDDIEPASEHAIGHMVGRLVDDPALGAVGARLVYPRREGKRMGPVHLGADLSLQHRGIGFLGEEGRTRARNLGVGEDPLGPLASEARIVPAATAAALLVRRSVFEAVGGFEEGYDYGAEDVDLCVRIRSTGSLIAYEPQATFWHHESATQRTEGSAARRARQAANWTHFHDLWGPRLFREVLLDRIDGAGAWSERPLHVGITLTKDDPAAGWGDWYTAHEIGDALEAMGWRVSYLERFKEHWYTPDPSIDVVLSLLDALDVRRLPPGMITVAWVRNWTDRWLGHPWFDDHDLILASSGRSKELIEANSAKLARLFPLATNPARFARPPSAGEARYDVTSTTNRWGQERGIERIAPRLMELGHSVRVYGKGWDAVPSMAAADGGMAPYDTLPQVYADARIVIDDTAGPTKPYEAVNSRVFDALATGTLVVTDNPGGSRELFDGLLPAAEGEDELVAEVERWLADPVARTARAVQLQQLVLERHTYARRARELAEVLRAWALQRRAEIAIGAPNWTSAERWGDLHFGRALQGELERQGMPARIRLRDAWEAPGTEHADVALQVFGLAPRRRRAAQVSILWVISHPDLVTPEVLEHQDLVFVASERFAAQLRARGVPAVGLHQATDPRRFRPLGGGPAHRLLFVANSRGAKRVIVTELARSGLGLALYGNGWEHSKLPRDVWLGIHVPNHELPAYYSSADIVLNDTWPDMAVNGFISNRVYDAAAAGACVLSDEVDGINEEFDGGVVTFTDGPDLHLQAERLLADPDERARLAATARAVVLERHTFEHRAATLLAAARPLLAARPDRIIAGPTGTGDRPG
jgi:GT2 family glycosyltransferase/spore maturation protein CgeB